MTLNQRRDLIRNCINKGGFIGFIKNQAGKQTYYTFLYHSEN